MHQSFKKKSCDFLIEETSFYEITISQQAATLYLKVKNAIYNLIGGFNCKTTTVITNAINGML